MSRGGFMKTKKNLLQLIKPFVLGIMLVLSFGMATNASAYQVVHHYACYAHHCYYRYTTYHPGWGYRYHYHYWNHWSRW